MVRLTKIYTRTGDQGQTHLGDGSRTAKQSPRVEAYGTVDEANAAVGVARLHAPAEMDALLGTIQNDLFDVGADLCTPEQEAPKHPPLRVSTQQVARLEQAIDEINAELPPLRSFVLPGGSAGAAHLHFARTVVRRAERLVAALQEAEAINDQALRYLNRLSDLLFVMARRANDNGRDEVLWTPGANR